jgi:preprotein translocase subunit SecG
MENETGIFELIAGVGGILGIFLMIFSVVWFIACITLPFFVWGIYDKSKVTMKASQAMLKELTLIRALHDKAITTLETNGRLNQSIHLKSREYLASIATTLSGAKIDSE